MNIFTAVCRLWQVTEYLKEVMMQEQKKKETQGSELAGSPRVGVVFHTHTQELLTGCFGAKILHCTLMGLQQLVWDRDHCTVTLYTNPVQPHNKLDERLWKYGWKTDKAPFFFPL